MDLSREKGLDPRVVRTRRLLEDAFERLLQVRPYAQITVKDIAAAATVNRATFYAHFIDKEDVFRGVLRQALERSLCRHVQAEPTTTEAYLAIVLPAVFEHAAWLAGQCRTAKDAHEGPLPEAELQAQLEAHLLAWLSSRSETRLPPVLVARAVSAMMARVAFDWSRRLERPRAEEVMGSLKALCLAAIQAS